uniref:Putative 23 kDa protein n=1 Tax=Ixodes ricinus TaxID=34613 RepID=A0A0K8R2U2_IXORI
MTPSVTCILLLGTALFFLPATRAQCINVTLPNVLGLGRCLGTTLRTCPDTSEGLLSDLLVILRCVVGILPEVANPASVLFNVVGLLEAVLSRLGISADIAGISNLICRPFGFALLPCNAFSPGNLVCSTPIQISLPSVFNIGNCLNRTLLFCENGRTISDPILTELVEAVGCILGAAPGAMGLGLARGLVCPLLDIVKSAVRELGNALPFGFLFRAVTRITQGLTDNILGAVDLC